MKNDKLRLKRKAGLHRKLIAPKHRKAIELILGKVLSKVWSCETSARLDSACEHLVLIHRPQGKRNVILTFDID